jgi:hypothetical protein
VLFAEALKLKIPQWRKGGIPSEVKNWGEWTPTRNL